MKKNKTIFYKEDIYKKIPMANLIIFGMMSILNRKEKCTFEKLVEECFELFPKSFSFGRHTNWPDSLKFDRNLRTLREKGLIAGNPNTLFSLTRFGEKIAEKTSKDLHSIFLNRHIIERPKRDAEINWISGIKKNQSFQRFKNEKENFSITDMEVRNLLHCTLETPLRVVKQNLIYSINLTEEFKEEELKKFLNICQNILIKK